MIRSLAFLILLFLIISTSIVKNSTKKIEDKTYIIKENLLFLENRLMDSKLEFWPPGSPNGAGDPTNCKL